MISNKQILSEAGIRYNLYPMPGVSVSVLPYMTDAGQLLGSYNQLTTFKGKIAAYHGWNAHHIVEDQDLARLGIANLLPPYNEQLCVLIPETAHEKRINSILRRENASGIEGKFNLLSGYREAYDTIGNYCGGGESAIRQELLSIVKATFKLAGI